MVVNRQRESSPKLTPLQTEQAEHSLVPDLTHSILGLSKSTCQFGRMMMS